MSQLAQVPIAGPSLRPEPSARTIALSTWRPKQLLRPPPPQRRRSATVAAAAAAADSSSPLLVPFTPIQKGPDYSLRLYAAYSAAECAYERCVETVAWLATRA